MIEKGMIVDPDHLSVRARQQLLDIVEKARYSGIVSSHSWSTPDAIPRIYRLGGVVTPMAGSSKDFVQAWRETKPERDPRFYFGFGWGADMNGFAHQGDPRNGPNPVTYPFKSWDGRMTIDRQRSGQRVYDINADGMAHYGLFPDWVEDLRRQAGDEILQDLGRGAEAYLQMWERAEGVPPTRCQPARGRATRRGLGRVRLAAGSDALLRRAGQPGRRPGRVWTWCVSSAGKRRPGRTVAVLTQAGSTTLVASTSRGQRVRLRGRAVRPGMKAAKARRGTRRFGTGVRARKLGGGRRLVVGVRKGRVRWVGVTTGRTAKGLRAQRRRARL